MIQYWGGAYAPPAPLSWITSQLAGVQANTSLKKKKKLAASSSVPHMRFVRASAGMWPWPPLADLWPLQTIHHIRHTVWQRPSPAAQPAGHKVSADLPLKDRFIFFTHFQRCLSVCGFFFLMRDSRGLTGSQFEVGGEWRSRSFRGNSGREVNFLLTWFQGKKKVITQSGDLDCPAFPLNW